MVNNIGTLEGLDKHHLAEYHSVVRNLPSELCDVKLITVGIPVAIVIIGTG